jgi:polar amino acid transport system substrate-binding protein
MTELQRRPVLVSALAAALLLMVPGPALSADDLSDDVRHSLAPTGTLRVGVYPGSPTSEVRDASGHVHGVAVELGEELGRRLGVPARLVEYPRVAAVVDGIVGGEVDVTVTNASPARAERVAFTDPVLGLELGV